MKIESAFRLSLLAIVTLIGGCAASQTLPMTPAQRAADRKATRSWVDSAGSDSGTYFLWEWAKELQVGQTRDQVRDIMGGPPYLDSAYSDGTESWVYSYSAPPIAPLRTFTIVFGPDGKLVSIPSATTASR